MKIQPTNIVQNYNLLKTSNNDKRQFKPCFKGGQTDVYTKILSNPDLSQKFMELVGKGVAAAAAALLGAAVFKEASSREKVDEILDTNVDIYKKKLEEAERKIDEYKTKNIQLEQEIEALKASQNAPELSVGKETTYIEFPKKRGKLSHSIEELKETIKIVPVETAFAEKLVAICQILMNKGTQNVDGQEMDNNEIAKTLSDELRKAENTSDVIDKYFSKLFPEIDTETEASKTLMPDTPVLNGPNVVGKIDTGIIEKGRRPRIPSKVPEFTAQEGDTEAFIFKIPAGIFDKNIAKNVGLLIKHFEKNLYNQYKEEVKTAGDGEKIEKPRWKYNASLPPRILADDVCNEIKKHNTKDSNSKYKNIAVIDPEVIAEIINSDPRYHEMFTIHSALRLIDRYIDFDSDVDVELQSKNILDKLYEIIQNAFKGGASVETYFADKNFVAPRLVIPAKTFDEEAKEIFGTLDLKITFCEKQIFSGYIPSFEKSGLICTIYSNW